MSWCWSSLMCYWICFEPWFKSDVCIVQYYSCLSVCILCRCSVMGFAFSHLLRTTRANCFFLLFLNLFSRNFWILWVVRQYCPTYVCSIAQKRSIFSFNTIAPRAPSPFPITSRVSHQFQTSRWRAGPLARPTDVVAMQIAKNWSPPHPIPLFSFLWALPSIRHPPHSKRFWRPAALRSTTYITRWLSNALLPKPLIFRQPVDTARSSNFFLFCRSCTATYHFPLIHPTLNLHHDCWICSSRTFPRRN